MNNIPVIIFDGPDNVGKGTQIKLLRKHFKETAFAITNMDKPVGDDLDAKERYGLEAATSQLVTIHSGWHSKAPQIADRAYFSEYAYSVLRKKTPNKYHIGNRKGLLRNAGRCFGTNFY